jgi:Phage integrase family
VRPHLGESLRAYANVTARVGIQMHLKPTRSLVLLDHQIGGVSQQQGSGGSLTFTSQHVTVSISQLPIVSMNGEPSNAPEPRLAAAPVPQPEPSRAATAQESDIFARSNGWQTCTRRAFCRQRSLPPIRPSFCPGCERDVLVRGAMRLVKDDTLIPCAGGGGASGTAPKQWRRAPVAQEGALVGTAPRALRHRRLRALTNAGHDTRSLQAYLGHRNIQHTVGYTELVPDRFKDLWR